MPESSLVFPRHIAVIGAGFIGTHVAAGLLRAGIETTVVNRSPLEERKQRLLAKARVAVIDASAREVLRPHLASIDHVVYCASGLMPAESNVDPVTDVALSLPPLLHVLELLRGRPGAGITYLSSGGTVYGRPTSDLVDEQHPTEPVTSYGVMKLAGENYARMYGELYGVPVRILRCANVYGEHQPVTRSQGVIAVFLDRIARGAAIPLYGDGAIVRDFVYVGDVVEIILCALTRPDGPVTLNVGSGKGASLVQLIKLIEEVTGRSAAIDHRPDRGFDVARLVLDIGRVEKEFGFAPISLKEGLVRTQREGQGRTAL